MGAEDPQPAGRPWWMSALMLFCAFMALIYVPWDLFLKPVERDEEVWFGVVLHGWWAKATTPLHWAIYAAGAWGFWRMRPWMWPWAAVYTAQVALGMFVWTAFFADEARIAIGAAVAGALFVGLTALLWRARPRFRRAGA